MWWHLSLWKSYQQTPRVIGYLFLSSVAGGWIRSWPGQSKNFILPARESFFKHVLSFCLSFLWSCFAVVVCYFLFFCISQIGNNLLSICLHFPNQNDKKWQRNENKCQCKSKMTNLNEKKMTTKLQNNDFRFSSVCRPNIFLNWSSAEVGQQEEAAAKEARRRYKALPLGPSEPPDPKAKRK